MLTCQRCMVHGQHSMVCIIMAMVAIVSCDRVACLLYNIAHLQCPPEAGVASRWASGDTRGSQSIVLFTVFHVEIMCGFEVS